MRTFTVFYVRLPVGLHGYVKKITSHVIISAKSSCGADFDGLHDTYGTFIILYLLIFIDVQGLCCGCWHFWYFHRVLP